MKFSKLEQKQIKKLCEWAKEANRFMPIRDYYACSGLEEGTGVICVYDEKKHQPKSVLYVDAEKCEEDEFVKIREYENNCLFRFSFIYKLERLGLITISKTSFPNTDSKGWACFEGFMNASAIDVIEEGIGKNYIFLASNDKGVEIVEIDEFWQLSIKTTREVCEYTIRELSSKLDIFGLVTSVVSIEQELFELVSNDFKTYEDIQLEEARKQTNIANESLKEARKQTESASASLAEAQRQTGKAKTQTILSFIAVGLSIFAIIASIFVPRCTPSTLDQKQFDTIQMKQNELIKTLNDVKTIQITNDSLIKELNLANESINEISNTLKEIKELNSKGK